MLTVIIPSLILGMALGQEAPAMPLVVQEIQEKVDYSKKWDEIIEVPKGVDLLEENYLPYVPPDRFQLYARPTINARYDGMRMFCVNIAPEQTFRAIVNTLHPFPRCECNFINFYPPTDKKNPMFSKLNKAWIAQNSRRSPLPYIEFKNTTKANYKLTFFVLGYSDNPYSIKLDILDPHHL
jgi:hypothetical protein